MLVGTYTTGIPQIQKLQQELFVGMICYSCNQPKLCFLMRVQSVTAVKVVNDQDDQTLYTSSIPTKKIV